MNDALGNPLVVRNVLLQAAANDGRSVGRLAQIARIWWHGTNGSPKQDEELYHAVAVSFGWGPGKARIEWLHTLLDGPDKRMFPVRPEPRRSPRFAGPPQVIVKAKALVRHYGVSWAVHVHSIETIGGMGDEYYGEQWLNPVSRPKFVDEAALQLPSGQTPGGRLGLVLFDGTWRDIEGALIYNLYIPKLFEKPLKLYDRPSETGGPQEPCNAANLVPKHALQQLAYVALDASQFGPHLLDRGPWGSRLELENTNYLKLLEPTESTEPIVPPTKNHSYISALNRFNRFVAFSTSIDPAKGYRAKKVPGRDNWTKEDEQDEMRKQEEDEDEGEWEGEEEGR
jgi:hypothetical protein